MKPLRNRKQQIIWMIKIYILSVSSMIAFSYSARWLMHTFII